MNVDLISLSTLRSGGVIAAVFPVLAYVIGKLKERNDTLIETANVARRKAEDSAQQLQFLAESMPQKIFTIAPDGTTVYTNPQWHEYDPNATGKWEEMVHPHDLAENMQQWKHSLETGEPFQIEHRLKRSDGTYIWHLTRAMPLRNADGTVRLWVGSSTDTASIRKTKKLEADTVRLTKQRTQLMELNKAKDEFISLASHQLRTPATTVKQYINMAIDGYGGPVPAAVNDFLTKANEGNERQLSIIDDLLRVAQVDAGKVVLNKEPIVINKLIASIIHDNRSVFTKRKQTVRFDKKQKNITVDADVTKLRMVLENVIDNASKYTPEGKLITLKVSTGRRLIRIAIQDEGVGISKQDIHKVFQKFMRLDNPLSTKVGGNGLGLYWVQKIVELHGGTITVVSEQDKGSTFTISLPSSGN